MIPNGSRLMNYRTSNSTARVVFAIALGIAFSSFVFTQDQPREKPKLKHFGSSIKRLKWDPKLNAAVETKRSEDNTTRPEDVEVIRVDTSLVVCDVLVLDQRGQPVKGLAEKDFIVTEDGRLQHVSVFALGDNVTIPRSIVLLIDYSSSQLPFINGFENQLDK